MAELERFGGFTGGALNTQTRFNVPVTHCL
jgi:hypothetical protein